jgi:hypothetical protein
MARSEQLAKLRAALHKGPMMARVDDVSEEPDAVDTRYSDQFVVEITE